MGTFLYYRTYPGFSGNNTFARDKKELVDVCVRSIVDSLDGVDARAVINNSTPDYSDFIRSRFPDIHHVSAPCDRDDAVGKWIVFGGVGSFFELYNHMLARGHGDEDVIMILEDDYLFSERGLARWISGIRHFDGLVSPYDPPDRYRRTDDAFARRTRLWAHDNAHWRQIESTTSTVGGRFKYFRRADWVAKMPRPRVRRFHPGYFIGRELPSTDRVFYRRCHYWLGIDLFCPLPGVATHLAPNQLSVGVDWQARFKELQGHSA
jgi:hypothetical protein